MNLSAGALQEIIVQGSFPAHPVLQIISFKKITANGSADRYRILLSDGQASYSHAMLATQLNSKMEKSEIDPLCVIQLDKYLCNTIQGDKRIIILLDLVVLKMGKDIGKKLGNPQQLKTDGTALSSSTPVFPAEQENHGANQLQARPPVNVARPFPSASTISQTSQNFSNKGVSGGQITSQNLSIKGASGGQNTPGSNRVHTIDSLTPYQNRWRIRARVTQKSNVRTWSNSRGEGRLFNVHFLDESGEIRATGFNEAVDKFYGMLEINKVYYVSKGTLKTANKQYSNLKNDYEMSLNSDTIIEPCNEVVDLPNMTFKFVPISQMEKLEPNTVIDVIGVLKTCNELSTVVGRLSQKEITKRDLQIVDSSGVAINLTLWGDEAKQFIGSGHPIIAVKGARLSDFGGRSLSTTVSSQLVINPDVPEAHLLRGWFDQEGSAMDFASFRSEGPTGAATNWKTFGNVRGDIGQGDKPDYFTAKATVIFIKKENCMYKACPTESCNKKVIDQGNGFYRCEKCQQDFPNHKWRMILTINLVDHFDNHWVTCFQESAETILGIKADELGDLRENNEAVFDRVFLQALFKQYIFRLRAKVEVYNEESRLKTVCMTATPLDFVDYGKHLIQQIDMLGN